MRPVKEASSYAQYRLDPLGFIQGVLNWDPWFGPGGDQVGQGEVVEAYRQVLVAYDEKARHEAGDPAPFTVFVPGEPIKFILHLETGHTVGKTRLASGLFLHFFYCFVPSILYTFAPTQPQINDLLWKEIRTQHKGAKLPGRMYDGECRLKMANDWFATGKATTNAGGQGTERVQGQHGPHLMFILDEAEGIAEYVYKAVDAMSSGGLVVVLMLANPRTRISMFHRAKEKAVAQAFHISCFWHPNVLTGRDVVPGAVNRTYLVNMTHDHAEVVEEHNAERHTFELPWEPGVIYRPDAEFMWRVMGIAPEMSSDDTIVPVGLYQAASTRLEPTMVPDPTTVRVGVDCARWGSDMGTAYLYHQGVARRIGLYAQRSTIEVAESIKGTLLALHARHPEVVSVHIRVDGGGGFGGGIVDHLWASLELHDAFTDFNVLEVDFGSTPFETGAYANTVTELYANTAEMLKAIRVTGVPPSLEADLTERRYVWRTKEGKAVRALEAKETFRSRIGRSPDDGDGFVLAVAPDFVFGSGAFIR